MTLLGWFDTINDYFKQSFLFFIDENGILIMFYVMPDTYLDRYNLNKMSNRTDQQQYISK